jgi:predicted HAD superfamily Cof-like phosphohydrolase
VTCLCKTNSMKVAEFMRAARQPVRTEITAPTEAERLLRVRLVVEEAMEFAAAMGVRVTGIATDLHALNEHSIQVEIIEDEDVDIVEAADALADLEYVTLGSGWTLGLPLQDVFDEVHRSNMLKVDESTGFCVVSPDGKVLKPEGWTPPDVAAVLEVDSNGC